MTSWQKFLKKAGWEITSETKAICTGKHVKWQVSTAALEKDSPFLSVKITCDDLEGEVSMVPEPDLIEEKDRSEFLQMIVDLQDVLSKDNYDREFRKIMEKFPCMYDEGWLKGGISKDKMSKEQLQNRNDFLKYS